MIVADPDVDRDGLMACQQLANTREFALIRYFTSVDSTNTAALNDLERNTAPCLYLADTQTAGRGRQGRSWIADKGTLTFTLVVPPAMYKNQCEPPLSIAVGVAIARTIEHLAAPYSARLKWPNDIYLNRRKVAGILIESSPSKSGAIVVGVGLNVSTDFQRQDITIDTPAISICELTQRYPHRYQWLSECINQVFGTIDEAAQQPQDIIQEYRRRCLLNGKSIRYSVGDQWKQGHCDGLADDGALLVRCEDKLRRLTSGEVQQCRLLTP